MLLDLFFLLDGTAEVPDAGVGYAVGRVAAGEITARASGATVTVEVVEMGS